MITLLVFTDGRLDVLRRTVDSAMVNLDGPITARVIVNDEPAVADEIGYEFGGRWAIHQAPARRGFAATIAHAWALLPACEFVFHLEDDFTFNRPVDLAAMATVLDARPDLAQLALRRQPWNDVEARAGGIVEMWPDEYEDHELGEHRWLEHRLHFTTNPSLYRAALTRRGWPICEHSERRFSEELFLNPAVRSGYWGARDSGEAVTHIGTVRAGTGY